jgi:hypothetical protein
MVGGHVIFLLIVRLRGLLVAFWLWLFGGGHASSPVPVAFMGVSYPGSRRWKRQLDRRCRIPIRPKWRATSGNDWTSAQPGRRVVLRR